MSNPQKKPNIEVNKIFESAQRLGIELDEAEARQWLSAMSKQEQDEDITFDERQGVFGHRITMLDFSPQDLAHFRKLGKLVEFKDIPGKVETALALSGSAAQSKIQTYPGDADYFERINILAENKEEACHILADLMRDKALEFALGPTHQLMEVRMGNYPQDVIIEGRSYKKGDSISWKVEDIQAKEIKAKSPEGQEVVIHWDEVALDPGWCKLDWVVADPIREELVNASNMLDVTWESPDGDIIPLDGYLDAYFQEVYLDAESAPIFSKLSQHVSANALDDYVKQLEKEVNKYLTKSINYGKAAKRMYNIFRLTGRYEEAALVRELFDEPTTMLYQVWALIRTMDESSQPSSNIPIESVQNQLDKLILSVVDALEGDQESTIVRYLLRLRSGLEDQKTGQALNNDVETARAEVINVVNNFFWEKLTSIPQIKAYIKQFQK